MPSKARAAKGQPSASAAIHTVAMTSVRPAAPRVIQWMVARPMKAKAMTSVAPSSSASRPMKPSSRLVAMSAPISSATLARGTEMAARSGQGRISRPERRAAWAASQRLASCVTMVTTAAAGGITMTRRSTSRLVSAPGIPGRSSNIAWNISRSAAW